MRPLPSFLLPTLPTLAAVLGVLCLPSDLPAANYGRALIPGESLNGGIDPVGDADDFVFDDGDSGVGAGDRHPDQGQNGQRMAHGRLQRG